MNADIIDVQLFRMMESIFVYNGKPGHEVIFTYTANFADHLLYKQDTYEAHEDNGKPFILFWINPDALPEGTDIFPSGLKAFL